MRGQPGSDHQRQQPRRTRRVAIAVGTIPGRGGTFTGSFLVTINDPLPAGVTHVSNQGAGDVLHGLLVSVSDDPSTLILQDPTVTQVTRAPAGGATKAATLFTDADGNGFPSAGDTLLYSIRLHQHGEHDSLRDQRGRHARPEHQAGGRLGETQPGDDHQRQQPGRHRGQRPTSAPFPPACSVQASFLATIDNPLPLGVNAGLEPGAGVHLRIPDRRERRSEHRHPERSHRDAGDQLAGRLGHQGRRSVHRCRRQRRRQRRRHAAVSHRLHQHRQPAALRHQRRGRTPDPNTTLVVGLGADSAWERSPAATPRATPWSPADIGTIPAGVGSARQLPGHHQQPAAARA